MTSSEEELASKKRPRTSISTTQGSNGAKKARGRPRVDTQDATATERRRTQIRLAQRAYRQRKETTIVSLEDQRSHLRSIVDQMNKKFLQLNKSALDSGLLQLNPGLAQEFDNVTETFSGLVKSAMEGQHDSDEEQGDAADNSPEQHKQTETKPEHVGWGYSIPGSIPKSINVSDANMLNSMDVSPRRLHTDNTFSHPSIFCGQSVAISSLARHQQSVIGDLLDQRNVPIPKQTLQTSSQSQQLPFGLVDLLSQEHVLDTPSSTNPRICSVSMPTPEATPPITRLPSPPQPYSPGSTNVPAGLGASSFEETTFARRLTRRTLEAGFKLLSTADVRPAALNRVFRLSLPFLTPGQIRTRVRNVLSRGIDDDLDWWETPFLQVGGAGTHYPPRDAAGRVLPSKNAWRVRQPGCPTSRTTQLEHTLDGRLETLDGVDLSGLEGQWFDAHDVQGYLEEVYACKINPGNSLAECLIEDDNSTGISYQPRSFSHYDATARRASHESTRSGLVSNSTNSSASTPSASFSSSISNMPRCDGLLNTVRFSLDVEFGQESTPILSSEIQNLIDYDHSFGQTLGLEITPGYEDAFAGVSSSNVAAEVPEMKMLGNEMASLPVVRHTREKIVTIDVNRLINEMIGRCVCLGRAPGFRRKDVDSALRAAMISAC